MNNKRHAIVLLTKSYILGLILVLVGCTPAIAPPPTPRNSLTFSSTLTDISTQTLQPLFSVYVPMKTLQGNEANNGFIVDHQMMIGSHENVDEAVNTISQDGLLIEQCELSSLSTFSFDSVKVRVNDRIFAVNELRNESYVFANPSCLASPMQNSEPGGLPNGGGGGGGGRGAPTQGML